MLTTSISLPGAMARLWRVNHRQIRKLAVRLLRLRMHRFPVRRGRCREYNSRGADYEVVCVRFTPAEHDVLHFVAYSQRVSVSKLISEMILLWLNSSRKVRNGTHVINYEVLPVNWGKSAGIYTEVMIFYRRISQMPGDASRMLCSNGT